MCIEQHRQIQIGCVQHSISRAGTLSEIGKGGVYLGTVLQNVLQEWQVLPPEIPQRFDVTPASFTS